MRNCEMRSTDGRCPFRSLVTSVPGHVVPGHFGPETEMDIQFISGTDETDPGSRIELT